MRASCRVGFVLVWAGCAGPPPEQTDRCLAPTASLARPTSIAAALDLIDSLPRPVTVPCLLQSFDRPLGIEATYSVFSAQPSAGVGAPRIFVIEGPLSISVVPDGDGRPLVEFGEHTVDDRTLKGELFFPIDAPLTDEAPFERVLTGDGTTTSCGSCHLDEQPYEGLGFDSRAIAPSVTSIVSLEQLRDAHDDCDAGAEPDRCAVLSAVFDHGEVYRARFPEPFQPLDR